MLGIDAAAARNLELVGAAPIGAGRAVLLRQRFGGLAAGRDGVIVVGVAGGKVAYVSSTLATDTTVTGAQRLDADAAVRAAAADAGMMPSALTGRPRLVAVPTPADGVRRAWEVSLIANGAEPRAVASLVDAETGAVLIRENLVDHAVDNPTWTVFPSSPRLDYASTDTRVRWCWVATANCALVVGNTASTVPWDVDAQHQRADASRPRATTRSRSTTGSAPIRSPSAPSARRRVPTASTRTRGRTSGSRSAATRRR